ncbi:MAG: hypothetical protein JWL91_798 [Sphingomonas bacterium]|nr:hypothetical protein [Sphingomonas bacterium]MDB5688922.1 hypothetical protein [Sphingomonas bacterium]
MADDNRTHATKTEARAGSAPGIVRYVLGISLILVVVLFGLVLLYWG